MALSKRGKKRRKLAYRLPKIRKRVDENLALRGLPREKVQALA